jgi:hypothetical protein
LCSGSTANPNSMRLGKQNGCVGSIPTVIS